MCRAILIEILSMTLFNRKPLPDYLVGRILETPSKLLTCFGEVSTLSPEAVSPVCAGVEYQPWIVPPC